MEKVQIKRIKAKVLRIQNAWNEGAPHITEFLHTAKPDFDADITAGQASEDLIADLKAKTALEETNRDKIYARLEDSAVDIRSGVSGHKEFGDDSALYGTMGFVRRSERRSGLTRGKKKKNGGDGEEK
jgi:hypothetical protein